MHCDLRCNKITNICHVTLLICKQEMAHGKCTRPWGTQTMKEKENERAALHALLVVALGVTRLSSDVLVLIYYTSFNYILETNAYSYYPVPAIFTK